MILPEMNSISAPSLTSIFYASSLWVFGMMVILFHRSGIQVIGTMIAIIGFCTLILYNQIFLSLTLLVSGLLFHSCGRLLMHMKRR
jgi:hypothetical protein